jgi:hypothetical protein
MNDGKQYYLSEVFIDDYTQADDRVYVFSSKEYDEQQAQAQAQDRTSVVENSVIDSDDGSSNGSDDFKQFVTVTRSGAFDSGGLPWKSVNITSALKIDTWDVTLDLTPTVDKGPDTEKGMDLRTLFAGDLSFFDSSSFRTEYTKIDFSISSNDLDCWENTKPETTVTMISKKEQERVKRTVLDNPLALLGYEVYYP